MAIYTAVLGGGGRWHDGSGTITYSFPTKVPGYRPKVDYDGIAGDDAVRILEFGADQDHERGAGLDHGQDLTTLMGKVAVSLAYVEERQEHDTNWLGASDVAAATNLLDPAGSDPASVLTVIGNAETLIAAHP